MSSRDSVAGRFLTAVVHGLPAGLLVRACKAQAVRHDLHGCTVAAVPVLILPGLETALHGHHAALGKVFAQKVCIVPPCNDVDEIGLPLLALLHKIAVTGDAEGAYADARRGDFKLRVGYEPPHDSYNIEHFK